MPLSTIVYFFFLLLHFSIIFIEAFSRKLKSFDDVNGRLGILFYVVCVMLAVLVAVRPNTIPDVKGYYDRFVLGPDSTSLNEILDSSSFYRGTAYSMSKLVNLIFYGAYCIGLSFEVFTFLVVCGELFIIFHYALKICKYLDVEYNEFFILLMFMSFALYRYQFVAFSQGMGMCFVVPVFYFSMRKQYLKAVIISAISCLFHVAELFVIIMLFFYFSTPKMKDRWFTFMWIIIGVLKFSGITHGISVLIERIALFFINHIIESNSIYEVFVIGNADFAPSLTELLIWLLLGVFIFSYNSKEEYWRLINTILLSLLVHTLFSKWEIVHRFTDNARMLLPIVGIIFLSKSRFKFVINGVNIKALPMIVSFLLMFVSNCHLMAFFN